MSPLADMPEHSIDHDAPCMTLQRVHRALKDVADPDLASVRDTLGAACLSLPALAPKMIALFRAACAKHACEPGLVSLYMVGGRVKGKPLRQTSDIDLIFCAEQPLHCSVDERAAHIARVIHRNIALLCYDAGFQRVFHVLSYGERSAVRASDPSVLLAQN